MMIVMMSTMTSWTTSWEQELINITREDLSLSQNAGNETPESVSHRNDQRGKSLKRKRIEQEDELIKKAINCMEKATTGNSGNVEANDEDYLFGRYIAAELKTIDSIQTKRLTKLKIQTILYDMQYGMQSHAHYHMSSPPNLQSSPSYSWMSSTPSPQSTMTPSIHLEH